jgi:hypothetical protein
LIDLLKVSHEDILGDVFELLVIAFPSVFAILVCVKGAKMNKNAAFGMSIPGLVLWAITLFALVFFSGLIDALSHACIVTSSSSASSVLSSSSSSGSSSCGNMSSNFSNFFLTAVLFVIALLIHEIFFGFASFLKKNLSIPLFISAGLVVIASVAFAILSGIYLGGASVPFYFAIIGTDFLIFALCFLVLFGTNEKTPRNAVQGV